MLPVYFADIEQPADVWMRNFPGEPDLVEQELKTALVASVRGVQKLERDRDVELEVVGLIDRAHTTAAQMPDEAIATGNERP